ncbi:MAG: Hydroxyacylglutathione hydrolase [Betaproteobacteria bacterium]|nr:Hydroxyacylglutathione hydrolase [Betaproteobacteria bacterium]
MTDLNVYPVRAFQDNYVWTLRQGNNAAVVDPGEAAPVLAFLHAQKLNLTAILNTHHHADHVGGNAELLEHYPVPVYGPYDDRIPTVSERVREGDKFTLPGFGIEFEVLEIPAHTRTHIAFVGAGMVFCGDTLFACGCGRLFEGTPAQMHTALTKLARLPGATRVYCGHEYTLSNIKFARVVEAGNAELAQWEQTAAALRAKDEPTLPSTLAQELRTNPFLRCSEAAVAAAASKHAGHELSEPVSVLGALREWKNSF